MDGSLEAKELPAFHHSVVSHGPVSTFVPVFPDTMPQ